MVQDRFLPNLLGGPILITGHTGFKGVWLTLLLENLGFEVAGLSLKPERGSLYEKMNRFGCIQESFLDIRNYNQTRKAMAAFEPATIIHLAAQPLVSVAFESPIETFETNVMGTANILEISRNLESVQSVGIVTTDKVYRNLETSNPFTEESELGGNEPYSASKVGAEAAISAWRSLNTGSSGYKLLALRSGNVIGGGDDARDRLIPDLAKNAFLGAPLKIRNYESTRPWQHVLDPLFGYLQALNYAAGKEIYNHAFNFGPIEPSLSVRKVVEIFHQEIGSNLMWDNIPSNPSFHESVSLELNSENSQKLLKWSPVWSQENSIRRSARWWQKYYQQRITASEITLNEISQYITALSDRED